jgi:hypothetical protein
MLDSAFATSPGVQPLKVYTAKTFPGAGNPLFNFTALPQLLEYSIVRHSLLNGMSATLLGTGLEEFRSPDNGS